MTVQLDHRLPSPRRPLQPVGVASVQGTLALDLGPHLRDEDERLDESEALGDVEGLSQAFAIALVEVLGGDRGPSQLLRWTTPGVYDQLQERAALLHRTVPTDRRLRRLRSQVRSLHLSRPRPGAVELAIHVRRGHRSMAVAARLEQRTTRRRESLRTAWWCTALELG